MTVNWWLVKHVPDQARNEPVNVGVLLQVDQMVLRRFKHVGVDGQVDGQHISGSLRGHTRAYRDWVEYLWEATSHELADLQRGPWDPFFVEQAGRVLDDALPASPDALLDHLYFSLVSPPEVEAPEPFEQAVDHLVRRVADELKINVVPKAAVDVGNGRTLLADYSYTNGHPHYMRRARQTAHDPGNGVMALAGYLDELSRAADDPKIIGFVRLDRGVTNDDAVGLALERLMRNNHSIVDLASPDAETELEVLLAH